MDNGTIALKMYADGDDIIIESTGEVGSVSEDIQLRLNMLDLNYLFDKTIFTRGDIDLSHTNSYVDGEIESKGAIIDPDDIVPEENKVEYSPVPMPPSPTTPTGLPQETLDSTYTIDHSSEYGDITLNKGNLIIDTTNGTSETGDDQNLSIVVDNIDIKDEVEVKGDGNVFIFVRESGRFITPDADSDQVFVMLEEGAEFTLIANSTFNGYIYGPDASVIMNTPGATLNGAMIADQLIKNYDEDAYQGTVSYEFLNPEEILSQELESFIPKSYTKGAWRD